MNQSVVKALKILDLFNETTSELSLKDISVKTGLPKPTAYRMLQSLESMGYIMRTEQYEQRYQLGLKLLELGHLVSHQLDLRQIAKPLMQKLAKEINEAVHLVVVHGHQATYIEKVDSQRALRLYTKVGKSSPLYIGSGPKLLLAYMTKEDQIKILSQYIQEEGTLENLLNELTNIHKLGYSTSESEQDVDTTGISYPIYNHRGEVIAALTVSGLSTHFEGEDLVFIKSETQCVAEEISRCLGYSPQEKEVYEV
ncbi:IclR family transcriptional regulator [Piscibacillus halophilus]|uniref:Glycerol operon regulatory protein n=1 Tax=Piscibacillus halophilus TaxID=571933 RepID=A0A1H9ECB3_9BACI|nr:IclR family transcriptional regulator [Piscibacillus halophilus]SEQ23426.1 transcriptional regulator, IclR family [Piscibacillus halophilus]